MDFINAGALDWLHYDNDMYMYIRMYTDGQLSVGLLCMLVHAYATMDNPRVSLIQQHGASLLGDRSPYWSAKLLVCTRDLIVSDDCTFDHMC